MYKIIIIDEDTGEEEYRLYTPAASVIAVQIQPNEDVISVNRINMINTDNPNNFLGLIEAHENNIAELTEIGIEGCLQALLKSE